MDDPAVEWLEEDMLRIYVNGEVKNRPYPFFRISASMFHITYDSLDVAAYWPEPRAGDELS